MAHSGAVHVRTSNREKRYCLQQGILDHLVRMDGALTPWRNWSPLLRALEVLWLRLNEPKMQNLDPLMLSSEFRRLAREMRPLLGEAGWGHVMRDDRPFKGEDYLEPFTQDIDQVLGILNDKLDAFACLWKSNRVNLKGT